MGMPAYTILIKIDARLLAIFATVLVSASVVTRCKLMPTITLHIILKLYKYIIHNKWVNIEFH